VYDAEGDEFIKAGSIDPSFCWAAGAMVSNLEDLKVWAEALGTGSLISESMQRERLRFHAMSMPGAGPPDNPDQYGNDSQATGRCSSQPWQRPSFPTRFQVSRQPGVGRAQTE
jgi:hypothetical protein